MSLNEDLKEVLKEELKKEQKEEILGELKDKLKESIQKQRLLRQHTKNEKTQKQQNEFRQDFNKFQDETKEII
jgi:hypothetical protein